MAFPDLMKRWRLPLSAAAAVAALALARPTWSAIAAGLPLIALGAAVRTWSSGYIRKNKALATDGPYAYTRNPLYLGSFLIGLGFVVSSASALVAGLFGVGFAVIYAGVIRAEEDYLVRTFGSAFGEYVQRVPRFVPRLTAAPYGRGEFDWQLVFKHREYQAWLGIAGALAILAVKAALKSHA
jgi:protein-S-isoprenylcysteine O-methyltransferase Ste14